MSTFLTKLELRDFRTFGQFHLDVVPAPGLTLMVGTNGLGKSTFFDGIEWGLTGRIRRFTDYVGRRPEADYLTRRDAERPNSHAVTLAFSTGAAFTRTSGSTPSESEMLATLKADGWGGIKDLGAYLALTHFLGQAAQQRFTSRNKNDQWEALKGPSGIDRLEQVRTALRGAATTAAFRRRSTQEAAEVELAEQVLTRWREDSGRVTQLRAAARAAGAPSATALSRDMDALEAACAAISGPAFLPVRADNFTGRLIAARETLEGARAGVADDQQRLERMRSISERYLALTAKCDLDGIAAAAAQQTVEDATTALAEASLAGRSIERAVGAAAEAVAKAETALERLSSLAATFAEIAGLAASTKRLVEQRETLTTQITTADAAQVASAKRLAAARGRQVARRSLQERRDADERVVERSRRLPSLALEAGNAEDWARRASAAADAAAGSTDTLHAERERLRSELGVAEAEVTTARRRASEMADALATVAKHVGEHDEHCPVCSTAFPPGALATLAAAAASGLNSELATKAQRVETLRRSVDAAEAALAAAAESEAQATTARFLANAAAQALASAQVEVAALLDASTDDDLASLAHERLAITMTELAAVEAEIALIDPSVAELEASAGNAARAHAALTAERTRVEADIAATEWRSGELSRLLDDDGDAAAHDAIAARVDAHTVALRTANNQLVELRIELASALATEVTARQRLDAATAARAQTDKGIADAGAERSELARQWTFAGGDGEPSEPGISSRSDLLRVRLTTIDASLAEADRLARELRDLATATELSSLEGRMEQVAGAGAAADPLTHERMLIGRLDEMRTALRATTETQKAVNSYTVDLKKRADRFSAEFLEPLNGLIDDFNRTLLSTPGETVQFSADAAVNRTDLGMRLRYADEVDNSRYDTGLAPQLVLSEGQLAANGFSILCAASVAYRWSNWRALLLDDPLQHNDIIHAAAFADVMRNLVEFEGYQLLMSSHDRAEGEFLFRKFDAAGLPCTMVTLTAPSREGVLSEPPRHNSAALQLLMRSTAAEAERSASSH